MKEIVKIYKTQEIEDVIEFPLLTKVYSDYEIILNKNTQIEFCEGVGFKTLSKPYIRANYTKNNCSFQEIEKLIDENIAFLQKLKHDIIHDIAVNDLEADDRYDMQQDYQKEQAEQRRQDELANEH